MKIRGIHHVTAIATDPQANVDFYVSVLGLRLVKRTVNFDDPYTYHLYYGDDAGSPGTILTFFPWPGAVRGRLGAGQTSATSFAVPLGSLDAWMERFAERAIDFGRIEERFGERVLPVQDPDGLALELVESESAPRDAWWHHGPVRPEHAIRGFHGVTLTVEGYERTAELLTDTMGWTQTDEAGSRFRFTSGEDVPGATVDVVCAPGLGIGRVAAGTVHHVAFRAKSDEKQLAWRKRLVKAGMNVTPVLDRQYFHSIYFREPGGVLFEVATDPPGFTLDEKVEELGRALKLPPWLEERREGIEARLPELKTAHRDRQRH
jgi:glyoxalase family protein